MNLPNTLEHRDGAIRFRGSRVTLYSFMKAPLGGLNWSAWIEELCESFPSLGERAIEDTLAWLFCTTDGCQAAYSYFHEQEAKEEVAVGSAPSVQELKARLI